MSRIFILALLILITNLIGMFSLLLLDGWWIIFDLFGGEVFDTIIGLVIGEELLFFLKFADSINV